MKLLNFKRRARRGLMGITAAALSLICAGQAQAQFNPLGSGLPAEGYYTYNKGAEVYAVSVWNVIYKYNPSTMLWSSQLANIDTSSAQYNALAAIQHYGDTLYVGGYVHLQSDTTAWALVKWNGSQWVGAVKARDFGGTILASSNQTLKESGGYLYAVTRDHVIRRYHHSGQTDLVGRIVPPTPNWYPENMGFTYLGDTLLYYQQVRGKVGNTADTSSIAKITGTTMTAFLAPTQPNTEWGPLRMVGHADSMLALVAYDSKVVSAFYKNGVWTWGPQVPSVDSFGASVRKGQVCLVYGDGEFYGLFTAGGFNGAENRLFLYKNNKFYTIFMKMSTSGDPLHIRHIYSDGSKVYATGTFKEINGVTLFHIAEIGELSLISGRVYRDLDSNCVRNSTDVDLPYRMIYMDDVAYGATDASGRFYIAVGAGTHTLRAQRKPAEKPGCLGENHSFTVSTGGVVGIDYPVQNRQGFRDMRVTMMSERGFRHRIGFEETYRVYVENRGTSTSPSGTVELTFDTIQGYTFISSPVSYSTAPGHKYIFTYPALQEDSIYTFKLKLKLDSTASIGSYSFIWIGTDSATTAADDVKPDNRDTLKMQNVSSYDPNDKTANPGGSVALNTREIRYYIRFQNEGNEPAYRVRVVDTLDMRLPMTKITLLGASHKYKININGNVITWIFDDIMLEPKSVNEPKSHGFIYFKAELVPGLAKGTEILNRAHIFFDYQQAIITPDARVMLDEKVGVKSISPLAPVSFGMYPNPASTTVYLANGRNEPVLFTLLDATGREVMKMAAPAAGTVQMDISRLKNGLYIVRDNKGTSHKLMINR